MTTEYPAKVRAAKSAIISPSGLSFRTKCPLKMMKNIPIRQKTLPRTKRRDIFSLEVKIWDTTPVNRGAVEQRSATLEAVLKESAVFSQRK